MSINGEILKGLVEEDFGLVGYGNWFRARDHDSLVIDYRSGIFFWNSRELIGNPKEYLINVRDMSVADATKHIKTLDGTVDEGAVYSRPEEDPPVVYDKLVDILWKNGKTNREYWYKRLLTDATIDRFKLGYYDGWFTIPFIYDSKLMNFQKRRDEPQKRICAWYRGLGPLLFNKDVMSITSKIIMTEGLVDAILLNQLGIPAISKIGGASTWNDDWLKFFDNQETVYLVFDNDDAGVEGAKRIANKLGEYKCRIYTFAEYSNKYDIIDFFRNEGTIEEFRELIVNNSKYSFEI